MAVERCRIAALRSDSGLVALPLVDTHSRFSPGFNEPHRISVGGLSWLRRYAESGAALHAAATSTLDVELK